MKLIVNGEPAEVPHDCTVDQLIRLRGQTNNVAVAVNEIFVPRSRHDGWTLKEHDQVELVAPMQGG